MEAFLTWKTQSEGGRTILPTCTGSSYYASLIKLLDPAYAWPATEAWSVLVRKLEAVDEFNWRVDIEFLVESAPHSTLFSGQKFELFEGFRCVASGHVM